ncbi:MAG: YrdB family protein [Chloroflexota bacterium]|nr:YrdB family protein [Chloroflexota bacterium]
MALTILKNVNLTLSFLLELCVLVALGYWGFQIGQGTITKIGLGIGAPVLAVVVWALFGAPRSARRLQGPWLLLLRVVFFGSAAVALFSAGQQVLGIAFALVFALNCALIYTLAQ